MATSAQRIATRWLKANRDLEIRVRSGAYVIAELWDLDDLGSPVGHVGAHRKEAWQNLDCAEDIEVLTVKYGDLPLWVIKRSDLDPSLHNQGWGNKLYAALLAEIKKQEGKAIVTGHACIGGTTSGSARRVWKSLSRRYPTSGLALALV